MEVPSRMGKGQRKGTEKVKGEHAHWMQRLQGGRRRQPGPRKMNRISSGGDGVGRASGKGHPKRKCRRRDEGHLVRGSVEGGPGKVAGKRE